MTQSPNSINQVFALAAKRGQSELDAFARNIAAIAQLSGLAPSLPPPDEAPPKLRSKSPPGSSMSEMRGDTDRDRELQRQHKPRRMRRPTLASVAKQARKAALDVARYEVKPDGTVVVVAGTPAPVAPENPWPLDELRTKETKQ